MCNVENKTQTGSVQEQKPTVELNTLLKPYHVQKNLHGRGPSEATSYGLNIKNQ